MPLNLKGVTFSQGMRYVAALIPGIVILAAIALASPQDFDKFMHIPELGYYPKLLLLVGAAYLIGFVLDEVLTLGVGLIFGLLAGLVFKSAKRREMIETLLNLAAPWRDGNWQKLASAYLGPILSPSAPNAEAQWRFWYLVIKGGVPNLEERFHRRSRLADAALTCSWALLIAQIILPGHRYLAVLISSTVICFVICGINKVRHPPRSGWLDEWGRLKGGRSAPLIVAPCAPTLLV